MNYSILIPTRFRITFIENLLKSIYDSTLKKEEVEIIIAYDHDDDTTHNIIPNYTTAPIQTCFYRRNRADNINNDYYNWMALNFAKGKYVIAVNDDTLFEMYGWDDRAFDKLSNFEKVHPDGIIYGITEDLERESARQEHNWMACFPLVSKKAIEVLGYMFDPEFFRDGADWALGATYRAIERVVNLRDCITIKHLSHRSGRRAWDILDSESRRFDGISPKANTFVERNKKILVNYLNNYYNIPTITNDDKESGQ